MLDDDDRDRSNESEIHIDFMIGSNELTVTGITREGDRVPVLAEGAGRSRAATLRSRSWRGAGAAERARLEIV